MTDPCANCPPAFSPAPIRFRVYAKADAFPEGKMFYAEDASDFVLNLAGDVIVRRDSRFGDGEFLCWARIGHDCVRKMLSTGQLDADGREVYDGDIIEWAKKFDLRARVCVVALENGSWMAGGAPFFAQDSSDYRPAFRVVGNMYEGLLTPVIRHP